MTGLTPTFSEPTYTGAADQGKTAATTPTEDAPPATGAPQAPAGTTETTASAATEPAEAAEQAPKGYDEDGDTVEQDIVDLGRRYEEVRMTASDHGRANKAYTKEKGQIERDLLTAFIDSGMGSLSLIMPGSGENRVLTPVGKIWPKIRPIEGAAADESGEIPTYDETERIKALRDSGLGHLVVEKIDTSGLNELFAGFASERDMPEPLARVYEISRSWSISSTKGRSGRTSGPTAAEVAQGRRPRA